jgi:hypothetical protein
LLFVFLFISLCFSPALVDLPTFLPSTASSNLELAFRDSAEDWSLGYRAIASSIFLLPRCCPSLRNEQAVRLSKGLFSLPPSAQRLLHLAQSVRNGSQACIATPHWSHMGPRTIAKKRWLIREPTPEEQSTLTGFRDNSQ